MNDLNDKDSPRVREAITRTCDMCLANIGELCVNTIYPDQPLPGGRLVHIARTIDRSRE